MPPPFVHEPGQLKSGSSVSRYLHRPLDMATLTQPASTAPQRPHRLERTLFDDDPEFGIDADRANVERIERLIREELDLLRRMQTEKSQRSRSRLQAALGVCLAILTVGSLAGLIVFRVVHPDKFGDVGGFLIGATAGVFGSLLGYVTGAATGQRIGG